MARIKITGYVDVSDLEPEEIDLSNDTGLSEDGYAGVFEGSITIQDMHDVTVTLEK